MSLLHKSCETLCHVNVEESEKEHSSTRKKHRENWNANEGEGERERESKINLNLHPFKVRDFITELIYFLALMIFYLFSCSFT